MARSKRLVHHPEASTRPAVRRRTAEDQPPETVTGDLNEPPPISGEAPIVSNIPDTGSSKQESPKAVSSSRVSDSGPTLFDDADLANDEEMQRLQEEYQQKVSAIKKRKEELEQKRKEEEERLKEEERLRKEEEERLKEEERLRKEEEDRKNREEAERRAREEEERIREEEAKKKAEEDQIQVEKARLLEEAIKKAEDERLTWEGQVRQNTNIQNTGPEQIQIPTIPQVASTEEIQAAAHSEETRSEKSK